MVEENSVVDELSGVDEFSCNQPNEQFHFYHQRFGYDILTYYV